MLAADGTWVKDWWWHVTPSELPLVEKRQVEGIKEGIVSYGTMWPPIAPSQLVPEPGRPSSGFVE